MKSYIDFLPPGLVTKSLPVILAPFVAAVVAIYFRLFTSASSSASSLPWVNPKKTFEFTDSRTKAIWFKDGARLVREWFAKNPGKPVQVNTDLGVVTVLPPSLAQEIRNDSRLGFKEVALEFFDPHLRGFEPFQFTKSEQLVPKIVRQQLTQQLSKITDVLAQEASLALKDILTDSTEWHETNLRQAILHLVARISSRVFLGEKLCNNDDWLRVTKEYTVASFNAAQELRQWSFMMRPIVNVFLPSCRTAQAMVKEARTIMAPIIAERSAARAAAAAADTKYTESDDAMDWFASADEKQHYDPAMFQLLLSLVAIHTTTDLLSETLLRIARSPQIIPALREEIISVQRSDGWTKTALYNMKLLDSAIKETQRMKPLSSIAMVRYVKESFVLSDGTRLQKGKKVSITQSHLLDASYHDNPSTWDPYRFVRMRDDPAWHNKTHLVSTSPQHPAFGHGEHACPGRFFAANEIKVALVGILIKYDFELVENAKPHQIYENGTTLASDPMAKLRFRRRDAEIDFE